MRLLDLLRKSTQSLEAAGIDDALPDAEMIVFHAVGMDRLDAYVNNPEVKGSDSAKVRRLIQRRAKGEPVQYIIGHIEFLGLTIYVGKGVLIPRPETELLVQEVIRTVQSSKFKVQKLETGIEQETSNREQFSFLDLCTGTGCIALSLAREFPAADVLGTDTSKEALVFAKKNAGTNNITNVTFLHGSLFEPVRGRTFHVITANPPYIRKDELGTLQREIRDWEPAAALNGGPDGMVFYRQILSSAMEYLKPDGFIFLELGYDQADAVQKLAQGQRFTDIAIIKDYAGIGRMLKARKQK